MNPKSLLLLLTFLFSMTGFSLAQEIHTIQGKVIDPTGKISLSMPVVLMEIIMAEKPSVQPVQKTVSDQQGRYQFQIKELKEGAFYRISTVLDEQVLGSNPIRFKQGQTLVQLNLQIPQTLEGIEHFSFEKHVLVFDLMEEGIRVTDIIGLDNRSGGTVDARQTPLTRKLPAEATNINVLDPLKGIEIINNNGELTYKLLLPQGRHQLFVTYDLPTDSSELIFENSFPLGTQELELIVPGKSIQAGFDQISNDITSAEKKFDKEIYVSQKITLRSTQNLVRVKIQGIPLTQNRLLYPAGFLMILLVGGLLWYLKKISGSKVA
ncbi:MAG: hypothetical protein COB67_03740 [SAR324 cluster bacterium]|uniref:Carboxypeptidase regulatory-like domain-containing protein n=1 Tax=SAR324 cluster bacterium TaxID=2024889 RepID=A0A2A4T7T7_9DELT|nr:MAG: hypothetical protein COB67_03740 [SAR324 cluster bacterium]